MIRRLFTIASGLSLLLCVATVVLWVRSDIGYADHVSWTSHADRVTLRSEMGRVALFSLPTAIPVAGGPQGTHSLATPVLRSKIDWYIRCYEEGGSLFHSGTDFADGAYIEPAFPLVRLDRSLLHGLESRDSFVAAHLALCTLMGTDRIAVDHQPITLHGQYLATVDGLRVVLHPKMRFRPKSMAVMYESSAEIDPAQIPTIRDQWHQRLDTSQWTIPYEYLATVTIAIPLFYSLMVLSRRHKAWARRLANHCSHCGYDLRASQDRCPECGTAIPSNAEAAA
jgi:hypothetical protein